MRKTRTAEEGFVFIVLPKQGTRCPFPLLSLPDMLDRPEETEDRRNDLAGCEMLAARMKLQAHSVGARQTISPRLSLSEIRGARDTVRSNWQVTGLVRASIDKSLVTHISDARYPDTEPLCGLVDCITRLQCKK